MESVMLALRTAVSCWKHLQLKKFHKNMPSEPKLHNFDGQFTVPPREMIMLNSLLQNNSVSRGAVHVNIDIDSHAIDIDILDNVFKVNMKHWLFRVPLYALGSQRLISLQIFRFYATINPETGIFAEANSSKRTENLLYLHKIILIFTEC